MPIYLTGFIDDHTDRWKHYHDDLLPLGMLVQPKSFREGYLGRAGLYRWVAIENENGRFTEAGRRLFRLDEYTRMIRAGLELAGDNLLFVTAPDVPFDWHATLKLSRPWLARIRGLGAALVAQEGMTPDSIPWDDFDCLFIGGDDVFKESGLIRRTYREAKRRRKWVHMGRVNGLRRLLLALDFGVDSVDGTYLLHEARKGRAWEAPHEVVGWLRKAHAERRRRVRRGLMRLGVEGDRIEAFMGYYY
jgi:hypothetical protein